MKCHTFLSLLALAALAGPASADDLGTAFTYQGRLAEQGEPVSGPIDLAFRLFDALEEGNQIGSPLLFDSFPVSEGVFTIDLDFGAGAFTEEARWLEIEVNGTALSPRQLVMPTPVAQVALRPWRIDGNATYFTGGNVGIGTSAPSAPLHVTGSVVTGHPENVASGTNSFVSGGSNNTASGDFSFVGGGNGNMASASRSFVGGGGANTASGNYSGLVGGSSNTASGSHSVVSGGTVNTASDENSFVGGGLLNTASGEFSFVGGGNSNIASGSHSFAGGGSQNTASGIRSFAAGFRAKAVHNNTFVWGDSTFADFTSTDQNQFLIRASGGVGIGTSTPANALSVNGDANFSGLVGIGTSGPRQQVSVGAHLDLYSGSINNPTRPSIRASSAGNLILSAIGNGATYINNDGGSGGVRFHNGTGAGAGGELMRLTPDGRLGIGYANPDAFRLAVNGFAAKPGGGSWSVFSDARLKYDIQPIQNGMLDRLLSLNGYTFEYDDEAIESRFALPGVQIGMLAQEVAEVFPDWVETDDDGYLFVTERGVTAIVVEALRELRQEKDAEIDELRKENDDLRARLGRLETMMTSLLNEKETSR